jgi:general secretion pathway protein B
MSFILDALKKSENDRQRQSGPALFEVRVAPPRSRVPLWAIGVAGLIAINLSVIGYLVLRKPAAAAPAPAAEASPAPAVAAAPAAVVPAPTPAPAPAPVYAPPANVQNAPPPGYPQQNGYPPAAGYQQPPPGYQQQQQPQPREQALPAQTNYGMQGVDPALSDERPTQGALNPDDYAPANPSTSTGLFGGHVTRGLQSGLPTYEEAASKTTIPPLRLDLHVYAADPRKRFVLVNMKRMYEGDSMPDGVKVDSITTEGAVLSFRGTRFVLERE